MEIWQKNALKNIQAAFEESGESQVAFSKNAKIGKTHFNEVLNGHRPVTRQLVATIAEYVKRPTDWFYIDHSAPKPETPTQAALVQTIALLQSDLDWYQSLPKDILEALAKASPGRLDAVRAALGLSKPAAKRDEGAG